MTSKARKNLEYTLATHDIEGLCPSDYALSLCKRMMDDEITAAEAVNAILEYYNINDKILSDK